MLQYERHVEELRPDTPIVLCFDRTYSYLAPAIRTILAPNDN